MEYIYNCPNCEEVFINLKYLNMHIRNEQLKYIENLDTSLLYSAIINEIIHCKKYNSDNNININNSLNEDTYNNFIKNYYSDKNLKTKKRNNVSNEVKTNVILKDIPLNINDYIKLLTDISKK